MAAVANINAKSNIADLSTKDLATESGKRIVRGVRTKVENKTDRDIIVTWKAASTLGKLGQSLTKGGGLIKHTYTFLEPGESYAMEHLYDSLTVRYYDCVSGKPVRKEIEGERKRGGRMVVSKNPTGGLTIKEELE